MPRAFTLIELLIVVAIIAILAAIAVPNFLEAQVRSKVARVKTDQRTIATAIESYAVDHNRVPLSPRECAALIPPIPGWIPNGKGGKTSIHEIQLTTPVAYMTSLPYDPFRSLAFVTNADQEPIRQPFTPYDYDTYEYTQDMTGWVTWAWKNGHYWSLFSAGPSKVWDYNELQLLGGYTATPGPYDPTNGTVSKGAIMRTNKGTIESWPPRVRAN